MAFANSDRRNVAAPCAVFGRNPHASRTKTGPLEIEMRNRSALKTSGYPFLAAAYQSFCRQFRGALVIHLARLAVAFSLLAFCLASAAMAQAPQDAQQSRQPSPSIASSMTGSLPRDPATRKCMRFRRRRASMRRSSSPSAASNSGSRFAAGTAITPFCCSCTVGRGMSPTLGHSHCSLPGKSTSPWCNGISGAQAGPCGKAARQLRPRSPWIAWSRTVSN